MFSLLCGRDGLTSCFQEKNSRANMTAMAKLWRLISPERIGFFLQKLEVLFASCYSIQKIFLRIFKLTGSGQIKMAQMSPFWNHRVKSIGGLLLAGRGLLGRDQHSLKLYNIRCSECFNMISDRTHVRHCLLYEFQLGHTCGDAFRNLSASVILSLRYF